ncbi:unnamed protein product [Closterium sp. Naga37s-1]|nr:unnamed protein product [Closterium sp. Naga37s-1]
MAVEVSGMMGRYCDLILYTQTTRAKAAEPLRKQYIVHLAAVPPVLNYRGGLAGLAATAPELDDNDPESSPTDADDDDDSAPVYAPGGGSGGGSTDDSTAGDSSGGTNATLAAATLQGLSAARLATVSGTSAEPPRFAAITKSSSFEAPWKAIRRLADRIKWRADVRRANVKSFVNFLRDSQQQFLRKNDISPSQLFQSYTYTVNGFAVSLTNAEAKRLKHHPAVARIEEDKLFRALTVDSPTFLKLPTSLWASNGGQSRAGEDVIIGVVDTGIWPEHPSFANTPADPYGPVPDRWFGGCEATADFPSSLCNGKLIGAKFFNSGFLQAGRTVDSADFLSARDGIGHGMWCAGAAAGNANVSVEVNGQSYGAVSGMAPRARIAMYKALWMYEGYLSDIQAAVDAAVADGVDVLSLSLGRNPVSDYFIEIPSLNAAKAGVFVTMSAGNGGTVVNAAPWYLTVGATTISRQNLAKLTLGNGVELRGVSSGGTAQTVNKVLLPVSKLLPAAAAAAAAAKFGASAANAAVCDFTAIDQSKLAGKIIVCTFQASAVGVPISFLAASKAAALVLTGSPHSTDSIPMLPFTDLPVLFLTTAQAGQLNNYLQQTANPVATLSEVITTNSSNAPQMTKISATGPTVDPSWFPVPSDRPTNDILKPDIVGPGFELWSADRGKSAATAATDPPIVGSRAAEEN